MMNAAPSHNQALAPLLRLLIEAAPSEEERWEILESLCVGIGFLHGRRPEETALLVQTLAERLAKAGRPWPRWGAQA